MYAFSLICDSHTVTKINPYINKCIGLSDLSDRHILARSIKVVTTQHHLGKNSILQYTTTKWLWQIQGEAVELSCPALHRSLCKILWHPWTISTTPKLTLTINHNLNNIYSTGNQIESCNYLLKYHIWNKIDQKYILIHSAISQSFILMPSKPPCQSYYNHLVVIKTTHPLTLSMSFISFVSKENEFHINGILRVNGYGYVIVRL